ncbi:hypothetical protein J4230_01030 [Candidatus Woesearchaeota archaeon]|nr:hypothetical protein [Candidatus Woesearchaeota archaeon]
MSELILDPVGYFLIRINQDKKEIEIAFCKYEEIKYTHSKARFGKNIINKDFSSKNPEEILRWVKDNKLVSREDHVKYLEKELNRAKKCLENTEKYIQD